LAAFAAVAALRAGSTVNEALVLKAEATACRRKCPISGRLSGQRNQVSDSAIKRSHRGSRLASNLPLRSVRNASATAREQREIEKVARKKELERDQKSAVADHLFE